MVLPRLFPLVVCIFALAASAAFTLAATGSDENAAARPDGAEAGAAVRSLTGGSPAEALAAVPDDFAGVLGYRPVLADGRLVRGDGGCSSPVALPALFEPACRQHDYGYDLLRYAERAGTPLGRWARGAIDDQFATEVRAACDTLTDRQAADRCRVAAEVAVAGVELNSVRQGDGVPEESLLTNAALASSAVGLLGLGAALPTRRAAAAVRDGAGGGQRP